MHKFLLLLSILGYFCSWSVINAQEPTGLQVSREFPQYWEYHGEPVLLLGGSDEDNLFQLPGLEEQLDLLLSAGGNYVRNTMSSRDSGNVWAFYFDAEKGKYDLNRWNPEYWRRFGELLKLSSERGIVVQVELWATFDFYRENWDKNPFNPKNNTNYTAERTKLPLEVSTHPTFCDNPFFWSVPACQNNMPLLNYQQRFIDKILSLSLEYDHVLYCIDNETSVTSEWGRFWSDYIRKKAAEQGRSIHVTEMWDPWDLDHISHRETFDHPETYSFVEISQNNHQRGQNQWDNGLRQIRKLKNAGNLRPVNNVKTYGNDLGTHGGGTQNGIQSFIRSTLFGSAAVRFHRPTSGLGLGDTARAVIHSMRMATSRIDFFHAEPHNELLLQREENEAYCRAVPGKEYLVYFPESGIVELDPGKSESGWEVQQLEILSGKWKKPEVKASETLLILQSPGKHFIFMIQQSQ
ncbi:MAG: hypothetical protein P1P86_02630 [Bacteroidales bacterium]|nr:hypothetical protein [Bacteroidales bacterium]